MLWENVINLVIGESLLWVSVAEDSVDVVVAVSEAGDLIILVKAKLNSGSGAQEHGAGECCEGFHFSIIIFDYYIFDFNEFDKIRLRHQIYEK